MKSFSIGAILSVTTGVLLADIGEVHELLDHMTGDTLFTHQLPRAATECVGPLREQFPQFDGIEVPTFDAPEYYAEWASDQGHAYGDWHEVRPLEPGQHVRRNPLAELAEMTRPDAEIIVVVPEDGAR